MFKYVSLEILFYAYLTKFYQNEIKFLFGQIPALCIDKVLPGIIIKLNKRLETKKYLRV